ncbi:MAG: PglZ domain-containing protein [Acidobacteria bacterium]|nr:PglZ domain-containing protein [Acidobacteriota bacterium]
MGVITEAIEKLIGEHVRERGLVLWFDPERHYEALARGLDCGQERLLTFDGSYYNLRLEAEPLLRGLDAPKLLVYLPIDPEQAAEPLAEMLALGVELRPGGSGNCNTRLAVVARKALKGRVAEARLADLDGQIKESGLTLAELENLVAESGGRPLSTALTVHFGTGQVDEAALEFLARPERDGELVARNGLADWAKELSAQYGLPLDLGITAIALRAALARQALTCELMETLGSDVPDSLQRVVSTVDSLLTHRAAELAREWRNARDIAGTYPAMASTVEKGLHLHSIEFADAALERQETFAALERQLLRRVAGRVAADPHATTIAETRRRGFWAEQDTELQAEWTLIWQAGLLLARAAEIEKALQKKTFGWTEIVEKYTGEANWAALDTMHRRLERRASSLEFALATQEPEVEELVHTVRRRHNEVSGALAEQFIRAWRLESFRVGSFVRQTEIYDRYVAPDVAGRRTAYVLVDALRWELARELPEVLGAEFETRMEMAIGTAPSITEVGMAALLPLASTGLQIGGTGKLQVSLHGQVLKNRADRIAYLKERAGVTVVDLKLEDPKGFRRKLKDIEGPALIFVTSREIDQIGEDETTAAREHMERVLTHLGLAMRKLAEEGVERFVITADHGYLYGEELGESDKIDAPGGMTILCHRRVWAGQGAAASPNYLLTEVSKFGAASDFEMAVPWNLAGFRTAGPTAYFHGGLSPQEILLPVIVATPKRAAATKGAKKLTWEVTLGSAKLTARFLSVHIKARAAGLFAEGWPTVLVEVRAGGEVCSVPNSSSYGYLESNGAVALRSLDAEPTTTEANSVALMLTNKAPNRGTVSIHVLDAATGVELKKLDNVEVSLAI